MQVASAHARQDSMNYRTTSKVEIDNQRPPCKFKKEMRSTRRHAWQSMQALSPSGHGSQYSYLTSLHSSAHGSAEIPDRYGSRYLSHWPTKENRAVRRVMLHTRRQQPHECAPDSRCSRETAQQGPSGGTQAARRPCELNGSQWVAHSINSVRTTLRGPFVCCVVCG